ncbi:hypothetical protein [Flagellimonas eckloniae]|uniref:Uncharacterized protein n=1 Tax=Flagellimonas eckloniae TaxID=346185 RepID=A0A0Q1C0G4_9FLAO|nr:hypothetical protein [Allomuricauda eckloniae]KQC30642.1 hypothetical protein AAY42_12720 [Allomuricauda eckloniae]
MKSNFASDLSKEKKLHSLLDNYYAKNLNRYHFERVSNYREQMQGIDLVFKHRKTGVSFYVDEKAQLDYINERLPTFAFELFYDKGGSKKQGWLFDSTKKTHFYSLVTSIYADDENKFTSCNITFVNRKMLVHYLESIGLSKEKLKEIAILHNDFHGKFELNKLDTRREGYLFFSRKNKVEKPLNLILKLDFLIEIGVAKKFV